MAIQMRTFTELPPLSLYVHIPWCVKKCPYCDFNSHEQKGELPEQAYINALLDDLAAEIPDVWGRTVSSVFIGGGTPSLFSGQAIEKLMSGIRALTGLAPSAEVTLEANPGTFEQERFSAYRAAGINRLSIGIQSFNDVALSKLGRVHSSAEAVRAVNIAKQAGFDEINLDIMFGLPEQSIAAALDDLQQSIELETTHLSCYELTLEPNTLFAKYPPTLPAHDDKSDMQDAIVERLAEHGFERYEISAYARPGSRCQHNFNYWQFGDYLGIGAGAHGKISFANDGKILRRWKHKHPTRYLDAKSQDERIGDEADIAVVDTGLEFMMNALRLIEGFPLPMFHAHTGIPIDSWHAAINTALEKKWILQKGLQLQPTELGTNWLNELLELFLPAKNGGSDKSGIHRYPIIALNPAPRTE